MAHAMCLIAALYSIVENSISKSGTFTYKTLEVLGPEHEFSIVNDKLEALPIADKIIKDFHGRVVNFVEQPGFTFGKELQLHVMEFKPNAPFKTPVEFEETMQEAILTIQDFLQRKFNAHLLGTGMHPLLKLDETGIWPHRHRQIYETYSRIFNLRRHGWLNIQSFHLNLPYSNEESAILLNNTLANLCPYLSAISASSPIYEGRFGDRVDNRLYFYMQNQEEIPSVTGDVIPEYASSFSQYKTNIIGKYSNDLAKAGADKLILNKEWVNSRGVIFRFDRKAIEIRIMDEQECIKSDVALSCFIRAVLRGLMNQDPEFLPRTVLVRDLNAIMMNGLSANVQHPHGETARRVCEYYYNVALQNATADEEKYLPIIQRRIERGNLSEILRKRVEKKSQRTDLREAIIDTYSDLAESLARNQPYF
jgi:gamma-glutamyl:cysteine ligase YbdK (ATP-grasp superfamily)